MNYVFLSEKAYPQLKQHLMNQHHTVIEISEVSSLYPGIKDHADLQIHALNNQVFIASECSPSLKSILDKYQLDFTTIKTPLGTKYPNTVPLNAVSTPLYFIHNLKHTDEALLSYAKQMGLKFHEVSQGYTRCTLLPLTPNRFITSDRGIYKALKKEGLNITFIHNGPVHLSEKHTGFFAGCCGVVDNVVYVNGDLSSHPDKAIIAHLCHEEGLEIFDVKNKPLVDIGSIIITGGIPL